GLTVGKWVVGMAVRLQEWEKLLGEMNRIPLAALDRIREEAVQIRTMEHQVGRAVALGIGRTKLEPVPGLACAPVPNVAPRGVDRDAGECIGEPQCIENARAIRRDLDAGANLPKLRRLVVHIDIEAAPEPRG